MRDAQGNVLAVYDRDFTVPASTYKDEMRLKEQHIYGSSRAGVRNVSVLLADKSYTYIGHNGSGELTGTAGAVTSYTVSTTAFTHELGRKSYEQSNHLGNVLVAVSDMRVPNYSGSTITGFAAVVNMAGDYTAFGVGMVNRQYSSSSYRYGYQGSEKENEIYGGGNCYTTSFRLLDVRLGRWFALDPQAQKMPFISPYVTMNSNPILLNDKDGDIIDVNAIRDYEKIMKESNPNYVSNLDLLVQDLSQKTGLQLYVTDQGEIDYIKDEKSQPVLKTVNGLNTSEIARSSLIAAIGHQDVVKVGIATTGEESHNVSGTNEINMNFDKIKEQIDGTSKDLDPTTMGYGLTFMHELFHTPVGGSLNDPPESDWQTKPGDTEKKVNDIREQLGPKFGKRLTYGELTQIIDETETSITTKPFYPFGTNGNDDPETAMKNGTGVSLPPVTANKD